MCSASLLEIQRRNHSTNSDQKQGQDPADDYNWIRADKPGSVEGTMCGPEYGDNAK